MRVLRLQVQEGASPEAKADSLLLSHLDPADEVLLFCHAWPGDGDSPATIANDFGTPMMSFDMGWRPTSARRASRRAKAIGALRLAAALPRMWWQARQWRPDVIDSSQQKWDCLVATLLAWSLGRPHVVHLHYRVAWIGRFPRWRLRRAAHVVALVEYVAAQARAAGARRVTTIHNSMPPPPAVPGAREEIRRELGVPAGAPLIGQIARMVPEKGPRDAVRALEALVDRYPNAHLLLMGDGPEAEALGRDAAMSRVGSRVHLRPRAIPEEPRVLSALDLFIFPSVDDISPLSLMKALAAGLPVAAYDSGGVSELVLDGQTGLLAPAGDVDALASRVAALLDDRGLRERLAQEAVARMRAEFAPERSGHAYSELLRAAVARRRAA